MGVNLSKFYRWSLTVPKPGIGEWCGQQTPKGCVNRETVKTVAFSVGTPSDISMSATADRSVTVSVTSECVNVPWLLSTFAMVRASSSW